MGNPDTTKSRAPEKRDEEISKDRLSEATSKETVSDLEEKSSNSNSNKLSDETSIPSPDGTPDPERSRGRADGSDTGGPM